MPGTQAAAQRFTPEIPRRSRGTTSTIFRAQGAVGTRRGERARAAICDALHAPESARALSSAAVWDANQRAPASCLPASERRESALFLSICLDEQKETKFMHFLAYLEELEHLWLVAAVAVVTF